MSGGSLTVSVITPAFSATGTIQRTLASLQAQTVRDVACVLVDDGSTDDTAERAASRLPARPHNR